MHVSQMVRTDRVLSSFLNIFTFSAMDNARCLRFTPPFIFAELIMEDIQQQINYKMRSVCDHCISVNMTKIDSGVQRYQNKNLCRKTGGTRFLNVYLC